MGSVDHAWKGLPEGEKADEGEGAGIDDHDSVA